MRAKAKRKLGDIGKPWVEDKGHDQTVFSDEYFALVPGSLTNEKEPGRCLWYLSEGKEDRIRLRQGTLGILRENRKKAHRTWHSLTANSSSIAEAILTTYEYAGDSVKDPTTGDSMPSRQPGIPCQSKEKETTASHQTFQRPR
ncbi:hypothetical protein LguiB_036129 [Lonicera macranthoides]